MHCFEVAQPKLAIVSSPARKKFSYGRNAQRVFSPACNRRDVYIFIRRRGQAVFVEQQWTSTKIPEQFLAPAFF
jgi:hypothetical protein